MGKEELLVAAVQEHCEVLGPGKRFVIWVQGCPFSCPGCIARSMRSLDGGKLISVKELADKILNTEEIEGITISGGEPFLQARELAELLKIIKNKKKLGIIVYSGFCYESLLEMFNDFPEIEEFLSMIDLLIDGPYVEEKNTNFGMKGSINQRTILLTERYKEDLNLYNNPKAGRKSEIYQSEDYTLMAGVPSKDMERFWKELTK